MATEARNRPMGNRPMGNMGQALFKPSAIILVAGWLVLFVVLPNLLVLAASLCTNLGSAEMGLPLTLANFGALFDPVFLSVLASSTRLAGGATLICLLVAYPFASALVRTAPRWRGLLLLLVAIPFWTNSLIRTYALIAMINTKGIVNTVLLALGIIDAPLKIMYTEGAVLIGMVYTLLPFMVLPLYAALEKIDHRLIEAARDLGASRFAILRRVKLPLVMPGILAGTMLVFLPALGMFYIPDVLGGAKNLLIGNFIKNQFLFTRNWPEGAAASVFLTVLMGMMLALYAWLGRREARPKRRVPGASDGSYGPGAEVGMEDAGMSGVGMAQAGQPYVGPHTGQPYAEEEPA